MPILGSDGSTATQYGGNTYIDTPKVPAKPTSFDNQWNPKPAPVYKAPSVPMGKWNNLYNPTPPPTAKKTAFDNAWTFQRDKNGRPIYNGNANSRLAQDAWDRAHPAPPPKVKVPMGKLNNLYNPTPSPTAKKTAFDNKWNPTLNRPVGAAPIGKLNNLFNPTPNPDIGAKTAFDLQHQKKPNPPSPYEHVDLTHGSIFDNVATGLGQLFSPNNNRGYMNSPQPDLQSPSQLANEVAPQGVDQNVWNEVKNFFTPQMVNGTQSDLQAPTQLANKVAPENTNYNPVDPIAYLLGGLASTMTAKGAGGQATLPTAANPEANTAIGNANMAQNGSNPLGFIGNVVNHDYTGDPTNSQFPMTRAAQQGSKSSSSGRNKTPAEQAKDILKGYTVPDGNTGVMITQEDGKQVQASKFDIENNPELAAQFVQLQTPTSKNINAPVGVSPTGVPMGKLQDLYNPSPDPATTQPTAFDKKLDPRGASQMGTGLTPANLVAGGANTSGNAVVPASQFGSGAGAGGVNDTIGGGSGMPIGGGLPASGGAPMGSGMDMSSSGGSGGSASGGQPSFLNLDLTQPEKDALMTWANSQALLQNNVQRDSLDLQKNQQQDAYNAQVNQLKNQESTAEKQLENQSFQNYLDSRQQIADRGLASSGLANDANTRLMLDRDQQLGQLQQQNGASMANALASENTNLANIAAQRSQINDQVTANNLYNQLYSQRLGMQQQANQLAEDWAKWNTTSGNYAYRFGVSAQNAQLSAATKLQVAQMSNQMKLATNDATNTTKLNIANGNLNAKMAQLNMQQWNYGQQQYIDEAKQAGTQAAAILKQIPNAASPQEQQALLSQYNDLTNSMATMIGYAQDNANSGFNNVTGGSGAVPSGTWTVNASNYHGAVPASYQQQLSQVVKAGYLPANQINAFNQLIAMESTFDPNAKNPHSTAYGYGQFLDSTRSAYEKKMGMSYDNPVNQLAMTAQYIKDRYGTAQNALNFHLLHGWY